ncbi:hypothetical protein MFFDBJGM_04180 [Pectobacterium versatile]|nr:hypothetical protein MFFDBJGM_04180 [Pectobacterium versatile]
MSLLLSVAPVMLTVAILPLRLTLAVPKPLPSETLLPLLSATLMP